MISLVSLTPRSVRFLKKHDHDVASVCDRARIIERQGEMVGYVVYDTCLLAPAILHVFANYLRQGIATAAMELILSNSTNDAMNILAVPSAVGFWLKMGFVPRASYDAAVVRVGCVRMTYSRKVEHRVHL